jgi:hypothetical protein
MRRTSRIRERVKPEVYAYFRTDGELRICSKAHNNHIARGYGFPPDSMIDDALERAFDWYLAEVVTATAPPFPAAAVEALRAALRGERKWEPSAFDMLVMFSTLMSRLGLMATDIPRLNLGDALSALAHLDLTGPDAPRWTFDPTLQEDAFEKLDFRKTSAGIVREERSNHAGWSSHGEKNRAFIEEAARDTAGKNLAVVLGAGQAFDLPLVALAKTFRRLVLVDIDGQALDATVASTFPDPAMRARVETRVMDLTGIGTMITRRIDEIFTRSTGTSEEVCLEVEQLCHSYRLAPADLPRILAPDERADLLVSSCVLTQLMIAPLFHFERVHELRFGPMRPEVAQHLTRRWHQLDLRVQQDHINALVAAAARVVLTSDVIVRGTALDPAGVEQFVDNDVSFALGVGSLVERIPKSCEIARRAKWPWIRRSASSVEPRGLHVDVEGLVLRSAPAAGSG